MRIQLLQLDKNQIFVLSGRLWVVEEVVTDTSDNIQHLTCRPLSEQRPGTTTPRSAFTTTAPSAQFRPETRVTIFDTQEVHELERDFD